MGNQIIQRDDGSWAVFSIVQNRFLLKAATPEQVVEYFATRAADRIRVAARGAITALDGGAKPYGDEALTYERMRLKEHMAEQRRKKA